MIVCAFLLSRCRSQLRSRFRISSLIKIRLSIDLRMNKRNNFARKEWDYFFQESFQKRANCLWRSRFHSCNHYTMLLRKSHNSSCRRCCRNVSKCRRQRLNHYQSLKRFVNDFRQCYRNNFRNINEENSKHKDNFRTSLTNSRKNSFKWLSILVDFDTIEHRWCVSFRHAILKCRDLRALSLVMLFRTN